MLNWMRTNPLRTSSVWSPPLLSPSSSIPADSCVTAVRLPGRLKSREDKLPPSSGTRSRPPAESTARPVHSGPALRRWRMAVRGWEGLRRVEAGLDTSQIQCSTLNGGEGGGGVSVRAWGSALAQEALDG